VKTFYSLEDIEKLAAQGVRELVVDEDTVLTAVARDAAAQLGLQLRSKDRGASTLDRAVSPSPVVSATGARPKGCQHGPLPEPGSAPVVARSSAASNGLVDDLVGAVRQLANKGSAG